MIYYKRLSKSVKKILRPLASKLTPEGRNGLVNILHVLVLSPVRLDEDAVDSFEANDFVTLPHGFEHARQAKIFGASQDPFAGADNELKCVVGEGVMA